MWPILALAAAGLITEEAKGPEKAKEREYEKAKQLASPWSGVQGKYVTGIDPLGATLKGGTSGAIMAQQNGMLGGSGGKSGGVAAPSTVVNVGGSNSDLSQPVDWDSLLDTRKKYPGMWSSYSSGGQ